MSKVKVSKAMGEVLNEYLGAFDCTLIDLVKRQCNGTLRDSERVLYDLNPIELSLAIANGHEVELTIVEKWNARIKDIKKEIDYHNEIRNYEQVNEYEAELGSIKELNEDFDLGLEI